MLNNQVYVNSSDNRSIAWNADVWGGQSYLAPDPGELAGRATFNQDTGKWVADPIPEVLPDPEPAPPTVEELMAQLAAIQAQLAAMQQA